MKRPNITPGPYELSAGRCIKTSSGDFYLSYGTDKGTGAPRFRSPTELDRIAEAVSALPEMLEALEGLLQDKYLADPINAERMKPARRALKKAGYRFFPLTPPVKRNTKTK